MNLQEVYNSLVKKGVIPPSRIAPIKSSLKRYAALLGCDNLASCPESRYNLRAEQYKKLINDNPRRITRSNIGNTEISVRALTNLKHDVGYVLREAAALGLIVGLYEPSDQKHATAAEPAYKRMASNTVFFRGETKNLPDIALSEKVLSPSLRKGLDAYYEWATGEFVLNRPRTRKRRPITADTDRGMLKRIAGFHVTHCGAAPGELTLESLTDHEVASKYVSWFIGYHGRSTMSLRNVLISLISLADYLMIIADSEKKRDAMADASRQLRLVRDRMPEYVTVRDKRKCWLSLEQIELCGINRYPRNYARLAAATATVRHKLQTLNTSTGNNLKYTAANALASLLVRLMIRIPLRIRNFMEMCWNPYNPNEGKNLFRQDGSWYIRFSGAELKIESRRGKVNSIQHRVPDELTWLVEEVLTVWRPLITGVPYHLPQSGEAVPRSYKEPVQTKAPDSKRAPQDVLLFLTSEGKPMKRDNIRDWVKSTTYVYSRVAVYPHLIRDIWATTYIKQTGDFIGAAMRLGDLVETVMKHYAHLLDDDAELKGDAFNQSLFGLDTKGYLNPMERSHSKNPP
jgi:hypothetical protein